MIGSRGRSSILVVLAVAAGLVLAVHIRSVGAQTAPALSSESLLSLVLPPQADGSRPGVHMWARADQANGPGGLPTAFIVTLYTHQTAAGSDEREVVNYAQYSGGSWAPARPQDPGTLLTNDWAWVSLNLVNLTATAQGQGDSSQYTVDYEAKGNYNGAPRDLVIEEVYGADLSLASANVLSDSSGTASPTTATATATPTATAAPTVVASAAASATAAATQAPLNPPPAPTSAPANPTSAPTQAAVVVATPGPVQAVPNTIRSAPAPSADSACGPSLSAQGYTWTGATKALGAISGQAVIDCTADTSATQATATADANFGCLLVGGQLSTLDGSAACFAFSTIQPQGDGNFLVVHASTGSSVQVQPIAWSSSGFASGQTYTACLANIAIPVNDASACTASG